MTHIQSITIKRRRDWDQLVADLRQAPLNGDPSIFPYKDARIESRLVEPSSMYPIAKYVLRENLKTQEQLHALFIAQHKVDTLDLTGHEGGLYFEAEGEEGEWLISPPIVEMSEVDGGIPILVDGEHRFMLAREYGQKVRVVWIEGVPKHLPVVALPVKWNEVRIYDEVPGLADKRDYRYPSIEAFPNISSFSDVAVNETNFHYFFYRDLAGVCSSAIRKVGSHATASGK